MVVNCDTTHMIDKSFRMFRSYTLTAAVTAVIVFASLVNALTYPSPTRGTVRENYFGTTVHDPYRWMEDADAEATKSFVTAQNALSKSYFEQCPFREQIRKRFSVWGYMKSDAPEKHGKYYFQYASDGRKKQRIYYVQDALEGDNMNRRVLLDPNTFLVGKETFTDTHSFSKDGEMLAFGISDRGSDWRTVLFLNVSAGVILPDHLIKVKFTNLVWKDNEGIFYGHFPDFEGNPEGTDTGTNENHKISYHRVGTSQSEDVIIVEFLDKPKNLIDIYITRNEEYLIVTLASSADDDEGAWGYNSVLYVDLAGDDPSNWQTRPLVEPFNAEYNFITDVTGTLYFLTNLNAPKYKIVGIPLSSPEPAAWTTLIKEDLENTLNSAAPINGEYIMLHYTENVYSKLVLRSLIQGNTFTKNIDIEKGTVLFTTGGIDDSVMFVQFVSHLVPNRIYKVDLATPVSNIQLDIYEDAEIKGFDPTLYQVDQVWYTSKDGTRVPMYVMHKKDLVLDGNSPAMLHGYGGFNIDVYPEFSVPRIVFMQSFDGVVAIANIRGGGEFGNAWHTGGNLLNKQNVFDDFHAAAEFLIARNYTSASKMIIDGGLLVGVCVNQRPELYGAAIASAGVMDMLRYHKFTIGHSWVTEYGSPEDHVHFPNIYSYSPLHNIRFPAKSGTQYPAVLVLTGDHDDRVVPSHSYKYIAELQHEIGSNENQTQPLLLRVETNAGHGAGLGKKHVDILSFLINCLDLSFEGQKAHGNDPSFEGQKPHGNDSSFEGQKAHSSDVRARYSIITMFISFVTTMLMTVSLDL